MIDALPQVPPPEGRAVILLAHGSADPRSPAAVTALAEGLAARTGCTVSPAFLDHMPPDLKDAIEQLVELGATDIAVLPLLLSAAFHVTVDVPKAIADAAQPGHAIVQLPAIGHPAGVLTAVIPAAPAKTVVVSAGTSVQSERDAFVAAVRQAADAAGTTAVAAFASGPGPTVAEAVAGVRDRPDDAVNVVPWLLAPGVFSDRVADQATDAGATYIPLPGGLIAQPAMIEELERRIKDATGPT